MKKALIIAGLLFLTYNSFAQLQKYRSVSVSTMYMMGGEWGEWSDGSDIEIFITLDLTKQQLSIYSKRTQIIDFTSKPSREENNHGGVDYYISGVDEGTGEEVSITISFPSDNNYYPQIYVYHDRIAFLYDVSVN